MNQRKLERLLNDHYDCLPKLSFAIKFCTALPDELSVKDGSKLIKVMKLLKKVQSHNAEKVRNTTLSLELDYGNSDSYTQITNKSLVN